MKKGFGRIVALVLSLCLIISMIPMSTLCVAAKEVDISSVSGAWSDSSKSFGINGIYSTGLLACGAILKNIASATGNEEIKEIASFLNVWVFGGNATTDILNEISAMCTEILSTVKSIDEKMDIYSAKILQQVAQGTFNQLENQRAQSWENDVANVLQKYNMDKPLETFFNDEALNEDIETAKADMSYLVAATYCKTNTTDKNGDKYTEADVKKYQDKLFNEFCELHGNIDNSLSREEKEKELFEKPASNGLSMEYMMDSTIKTLSHNLTKVNNNSYADNCAQIAFKGSVNMADQKDYVMTNLNRQVMAIVLTEMMYQEYLSMRGEYLQTHYDESSPLWQDYVLDVYGSQESYGGSFKDLNTTVKNDIENRLKTPLKLSSTVSLAIGQYPSQTDLQGVKLNNTTYMNKFGDYEYEKSISTDYNYALDDEVSKSSMTTQYMQFDKLPVYTENGIEMYYVFVDEGGSKNSDKTKLIYCDFGAGNDFFVPSCDFFNLTRGVYSDSVNTFSSPSLPKNEATLFNTDTYALSGGVPSKYLNKYYSNYTDKSLYQVFPEYTYGQNGAFRDPQPYIAALDMNADAPSFNLNWNDQMKISGQDIHEGYDSFNNGFYYTVILKNNSTQTKFKGTTPTLVENTLSYSVTGVHNAEVIIEESDGTIVNNGDTVPCGEPLTLKIKPQDVSTDFESLKILKYNDTQNPTTPTSEETILTANDFNSLKQKDGYYIIDFNMPYSNAQLVLQTKNVINKDEDGNFILRNYYDLLDLSTYVNKGEEEYVSGSYVITEDIQFPEGVEWTRPIGTSINKFKGTVDGQGHSIKGFSYHNGPSLDYASLFAYLQNATLKNIVMEDVDIVCKNQEVGVLCGSVSNSIVSNCTVSGAIDSNGDVGEQAYSGAGICCNVYQGSTVENCINYCVVDSYTYNIGGICGINYGTVKNCANFGTVSGYLLYWDYMNKSDAYAGGIVGENNGVIKDSYNAGTIKGSAVRHSICGNKFSGSMENCYYLNTIASDSNATAKTKEQFASGEVAYLLNRDAQVWFQNIDNGKQKDEYPVLISNGVNTVYLTPDDKYTNTKIVIGDANGDDVLSVMDPTHIQQHVAEIEQIEDKYIKLADIDRDGQISISDATTVQQIISNRK